MTRAAPRAGQVPRLARDLPLRRHRPPSIRDVADRAGVSPSAVSLVLNGKGGGRVSIAKQEAVRRAVADLGYRTDSVARSLATGRTGTVAVIVPDLASSFFNDVTMGIATGLPESLQVMLVLESRDGDSSSTVDRVLGMRPDAILYEGPNAQLFEGRSDVDCAVISLDNPSAPSGSPSVQFDLSAGAQMLADHLLGLGHRRFAFLTPVRDAPTFQSRRLAFEGHLRTKVGSGALLAMAEAETTIGSATIAVETAWASWRREGITALVCATDIQAFGALLACKELHVSVPRDLSVASFDDVPFSVISTPQLTTVSLPAYELGRRAAELVEQALRSPLEARAPIIIPTSLVVRESTARPRGAAQRTRSPRSP